ncbi:MAG: TolC family protein, partial [Planctomycetota bacterium JB042]
ALPIFSGSREALDDEVVKLTEVEQIREEIDAALGIRVPLPSGGEVALEQVLDSKRIVDPDHYDQYLAAMRFSFSQPLMRGAGPDANFARIRLARVNRRITQVRTKLAALRILVDAEKAYWRLYAARKFFDVRVEQYRLAAEGLEMVRRRVAEGITPEVETVRAEVGVYRSLEKLIVAETDWRLRQRDLKRYLASEGFPLDGEETIEVATDPHLAGLEVDAEALVEQAIRTRPELIEAELRIVRDGVDIAYRQNQVLPIVNLDFQYGVLDRDDSFGSAWASQFGFEHSDFSVGLSFEVPLTNQTPRAELRRAMLSRSLQMASREARELVVREEVLDMIDVMDQNWQRIIAARQNVIVAGVNYDAESRQFREGLRTMREVLEALSDLGEARIREVRAIVEYQVAQIDLAFASGTLLGYARVGLESLRLP